MIHVSDIPPFLDTPERKDARIKRSMNDSEVCLIRFFSASIARPVLAESTVAICVLHTYNDIQEFRA